MLEFVALHTAEMQLIDVVYRHDKHNLASANTRPIYTFTCNVVISLKA